MPVRVKLWESCVHRSPTDQPVARPQILMTGPTSLLGASLLVGLSNQSTETDIIAFVKAESDPDAFQHVNSP